MVFRRELYGCFTARADALFELADAVLCADGPVRSLAELSLCPVFRRGHGALYDALAAGGVDQDRLRDALIGALPEGLPLLFAVDVSAFPRPDAVCSPGRVHCYAACRCDGRRKTIPGWNYSRVTGVDWGASSWVYPVDAVRLAADDDQVEVTARQVRDLVGRLEAAGRCGGPGQPVPVAIFDGGYSPPALTHALAGTGVQVLVRLRDEKRRAFYGPPPGRVAGQPGRPRRHGTRFKLAEAGRLARAGPGPDRGGLRPLRPGRGPRLARAAPEAAGPRPLRGPPAARRRARHRDPGQRGAAARRADPGRPDVAVVGRATGNGM